MGACLTCELRYRFPCQRGFPLHLAACQTGEWRNLNSPVIQFWQDCSLFETAGLFKRHQHWQVEGHERRICIVVFLCHLFHCLQRIVPIKCTTVPFGLYCIVNNMFSAYVLQAHISKLKFLNSDLPWPPPMSVVCLSSLDDESESRDVVPRPRESCYSFT